MPEKLHELRFVSSRLQLIQDFCEPLLAHLGERLRCQLGIRCRAASL